MMGKFLTTSSAIEQTNKKGIYTLLGNELYKDDDGRIYLAWRGFRSDNFTWINSSDWDIRCSHGHDVGCKYHQVVEVLLTEHELKQRWFIRYYGDHVYCVDIPKEYLKVKDVSGNWINNLFFRMLRDANSPLTPKWIQYLYRAGVALNLNWFRTGKTKINLDKLYDEDWNING